MTWKRNWESYGINFENIFMFFIEFTYANDMRLITEKKEAKIYSQNYPWAVLETPVASATRKPPLVVRWE